MGDAEEAPEAVHPNQGTANSLPLPTKFDGTSKLNQADLWPKWLRRFERYRIASGLQNKTEQEQVGTLLYAMGECADDIITTLRVNEETASYTDVRAALNGYFAARRNTIVERARFNTRKQTPEESVDTFIQDLYRIAEDCDYGTLKDQLIRDRIVVGVLDNTLSDRLQAKSDLTLADAVRMSHQAEARKQNRTVVQGEEKPNDVEKPSDVDYVNQPRPSNGKSDRRQTSDPKKPNPKIECFWCGRQSHERRLCPAKDVTCNNCHKKGHYQSVCRSKKRYSNKVHEVEEDSDEVFFLGEINSASTDYWTAQIEVNGHNTLFKLDTGAGVTVLSDNVEWLRCISLTETSHTLGGPGNIRLPVKGQFYATLKYGQTSITEPVYVLHNQTCSLLSRKACVELGLIKRAEKDVEEVNSGPTDFKAEFPSLFTGLGRLKTECHITLRADAKPFCLYNPRKLPHPLLPKVKSQIETMLEQGVISPVTAPTE